MRFDETPGRTAGSVMMMTTIIAKLVAEKPDGFLDGFDNLARTLIESAKAQAATGQESAFIADMAGGAEDMLETIREMAAEIQSKRR